MSTSRIRPRKSSWRYRYKAILLGKLVHHLISYNNCQNGIIRFLRIVLKKYVVTFTGWIRFVRYQTLRGSGNYLQKLKVFIINFGFGTPKEF